MDNPRDKIINLEACQQCGRNLKEEWIFCPFCKHKVEISICPFCREEIKKTWEFCPYCKSNIKNLSHSQTRFNSANDWLKSMLED